MNSHTRTLQSLGLRRNPQPQYARLAHHQEGLGDVNHNEIPTKEADQHAMSYPIRVSGYNHAVIRVENPQAPPECLSQLIVIHSMVFHCHGQICTDDTVHEYIEECQRHKAALSFPCLSRKAGPWYPLCLGTNCWWDQKVSKITHMQATAQYPSKVWIRRSLFTVS